MKVSLNWLNSYLDRPVDADAAADLLGEQGFPVEERDDLPDGDVMLNVEVTSNRGDCLSHVGVARELAAGSGRQLRPPVFDLPDVDPNPATALTSVVNKAPDLCPVYTARVIRGVRIAPSPDWLRHRLEAIGLRPVNNVVDITNFVLHEMGQPLHAFDMAKLNERRIVVRRAEQGEAFTAIDGTKHALGSDMLVIADANRPVAIAGVMGGVDSEVTDATTDILLESARFAQLSVRRTSRSLKLASDSSYRFERGVDPVGVEAASRRAAQLIVELAGGRLAEGVVRVGEDQPASGGRTATMRIARCNALLGMDLTAQQQADCLDRLGLNPTVDATAGTITCAVPTFRLDLEREVDLIEEVARLTGLGNIPTTQRIHIVARPPQIEATARQRLAEVLVAHGYHETITFSFISEKHGKAFLPAGAGAVTISDERRKAEPMLRPSVLPSLLACRKTNQDVGNADVRLFETASVWHERDGKKLERRTLGLLCDADDAQQALRGVRSAIAEVVERLAGDVGVRIDPGDDARFDGGARVIVEDQPLGAFGLLSAKLQALFDLQTPVVVAELEVERLLARYPASRQVGDLPRFPGIERDLSVVVADSVPWAAIEQAVHATSPAMLESLAFTGIYRGKPIEKGKKSVTFRMTYRDPAGTLRHDQVDPQMDAVVKALKDKVGAELRA